MKRKNKKTEAPAENAAVAEETVSAPAAAEEPAEEAKTESAEVAEVPSEEAPHPGKAAKTPSAASAIAKITLPLSIICIVVALMLAVVNALTADTIAANAAREKEAAILSIFPEGSSTELNYAADGTEVYRVKSGDTLIGYCASLSENGFGGAISMMVGVDPAGYVCGVKIVSLSETPGIGTKVKNDSFLNLFSGNEPFVIGENFDAISGATVSSKAVVRGVNRARSAVANTFELAAVEEDVQMQLPQTDASVTAEAAADAVEIPSPVESSPIETVPAEENRSVVNLASVIPGFSITSAGKSANRVILAGAETVYVEETTAPPETEPAPLETLPMETAPIETIPAETVQAETAPAETVPAETAPAETVPAAAI